MNEDKKIKEEIEDLTKEEKVEKVEAKHEKKTEKSDDTKSADNKPEAIDAKVEENIKIDEKLVNGEPDIKIYKKSIFAGLVKKIVIALIALSFVAMIIAFFAFRIDGIFFPSTLNVFVLDHNNEAMKDVLVFVDGKQVAKTNDEGKFSLVKGYGTYKFVFKYEKFDDLIFTIDVKRGTNDIKVSMRPNGIGDLVIRFMPTDGTFNTDNLLIEFDDKAYELSLDGELSINKFPIGTYKFKLSSPYYYDVYSDIEVKAGDNRSEIQLADAWDVNLKVIDWISAKPIEKAKVSLEGFKFESDKNGYIQIKDLTKTANVLVTAIKDGYLDKNVNINNVDRNSDSEIKVELVRNGKVVYISNRTGNKNIYAANYDGNGEVRLSDNKGDNVYPQKINGTNIVRFLSTRDNVKNVYSAYINMPYSVNLDASKLTKLAKSNYPDNNSIGLYNFISLKRSFTNSIYNQTTNQTTEYLYFGNIDGTASTLLLEKVNFTFQSIIISNNGDVLAFYGRDGNDDATSGIYTINTKTKELKKILLNKSNIELISFSPDQSKVMGILDENTSDLIEINLSTQKFERLTNSSAFEEYPKYFNPNTILYLSSRDGKKDIYAIDIAKKTETKLTMTGDITDYEINDDGVILFYSNKTLWALDFTNPNTPKKITNNVISSADLPSYSSY